jgi:hypothetical protein
MDALNRPVKRQDYLSLLIGVFVGGSTSYFFLSKGDDPLGLLLTFAVFYPVLFAGVCLHELGHAWGALSAGGTVGYIELGRRYERWKPWQFRLLGVRWVINSAPTCGLAHVSFPEAAYYRARQCWMIACGPLVNLLLLSIGLLILLCGGTLHSPLLLGWCMAQGLLFAISVIPRVMLVSDTRRPNDALLFWQTLRLSDEEVLHRAQIGKIARRLDEAAPFARSATLAELIERHEANPNDLPILWHLAYRLSESSDPREGTYFGKLADHPEFPEKDAVLALDIHLTQQLHVGPPEDHERADRLSQRLLALSNSISTRGTRGSVLVDLGRVEEGKRLLAETSSKMDRAYANAFLALAAKAEGQLDAARKHAAAARKTDPASPVLARVTDLL